jgi:hypothetical protein
MKARRIAVSLIQLAAGAGRRMAINVKAAAAHLSVNLTRITTSARSARFKR